MTKLMVVVLLTFSATCVFSQELKPINISDIKTMDSENIPAPKAVKSSYQHVWMNVQYNPSFKEAQANDWSARIETRVRETFKDSYDVNIRTDNDYKWASIRKSGNFYSMSSAEIYLTMSGSDGSYFINGHVRENGKTTYISANISRRFDDFSFSIFGSGLNLYTDRYSVSGNYNSDQISKKGVAATISMVMALYIEKGEPQPETKTASSTNQRIWMTINPGFGGWNDVEARDPWAKIEVGVRKVFDREYNVEIEVENNRQWGRVSNFFTDRYELTAGSTDLEMRRWAGRWEIKGTVKLNTGTEKVINLKLEEKFGDGSFYIWENGIRLDFDRNSISGDVDIKIYPKEVIASITALVMTYQQINKPQTHQEK